MEKRKTHTSSAVKRRYNERNYRMITVQLPIALVEEFRERCRSDSISQASVIREAIESYLCQ